MSLTVKRQITSKRRYYAGTNPCNGATAHMTANTRVGADAQAHADLQSRGSVALASWHKTVDDLEAIQSYEDYRKCWHAGDGHGPGNTETISYELCVNSDGDYVKMIFNAAELIGMDAKKYGWKRSDIHQHNEFSSWGKNCPRELRGTKADISWEDFLDMIFTHADEVMPRPAAVKVAAPTHKANEAWNHETAVDGWWGLDVTIELQHALDSEVDGEVWYQSPHWLDRNSGLTTGWKESTSSKGSPLIYALYDFLVKQGVSRYALGKRDGKIGPAHIKGLQTWLTKIGYYHGLIDGLLEAKGASIKGLQKAINDGKIK